MPKRKATTKIKIIRIALFVGTAISLWFVPWTILWAWIQPLPDTVQEQVDQAVDLGFDGVIVYVDQKGKPPAFYAGGWHDPKEKIAADPHALFKIASIGKLYAAVSITKLINDGKLSLDGTLAEYFPELIDRIEYADQISLRMMVQHRSGIPNYTDTPNYWVSPPDTAEGTLALILDQPASFPPNTDYQYSNTNYLLISMLIEKVTGSSKSDFINKEIVNPLGLQNTYGSISEVDPMRVMSGYHVGYPHDLRTANQGMVASAEDVGIFLRALNDGSIFKPGEQEIYSSIYVYNHTGLVPGYQSIAKYHPEMDAVVVQFTSPSYFEGYNWSISELVYDRIIKTLKKQNDS